MVSGFDYSLISRIVGKTKLIGCQQKEVEIECSVCPSWSSNRSFRVQIAIFPLVPHDEELSRPYFKVNWDKDAYLNLPHAAIFHS